MYGDTPAVSESKSPADAGDESKSDSPTAVLPKSILMGKEFKPGDEVVLKIVRMHEDEIEVEYATGEEEKGEGEAEEAGEGGKATMPTGDKEMASYME